ncbi:MAG: hypothetical protein AAF843_12095 [Bacteroidota bacterium]
MKYYKQIFLIILFFHSLAGFSQPNNPGDPTDIPLSGIEYLLIAGAALGISRIQKRKR